MSELKVGDRMLMRVECGGGGVIESVVASNGPPYHRCQDDLELAESGGRAVSETQARPVVIRMPAELHRAVKDKAAREERSMAQAIRYALRRYVATQDEACAAPAPRSEAEVDG